ncbi:MAG: hypothetical protein AAF648_12700 [Pseudomonadota bacterium]
MPLVHSAKALVRVRAGLFALAALVGVESSAQPAAALIYPSDKGGFQYSDPPSVPEVELDLSPIEREVARAASTRCGTALAAEPLDLGKADSFLGNLAGNAAKAAVGQLVGGLLGSPGGGSKKPKMDKDPVKKKYKQKIAHPEGNARLLVGGQLYEDGMVLSARVDKAKGKGTFHTMFLERPDCTRIWPEEYLRYGLWGSFKLSVSVTKTTSSYRNGRLVDRSVDRSNWSKAGTFDFNRGFSIWDQLPGEAQRMVLDADEAYLTQLRNEIGTPAWQELGFAKPVQGLRSAGGLFRVQPSELTPGTIAVVHITSVDEGRYKTIGFPMTFEVGKKGRISFEALNE